FEQDFFPAFVAFGGCGDERLVSAGGCERNDRGGAEFGSFFQGPFEAIELYEGEEELDLEARCECRDGFDQGEVDAALAVLGKRNAFGLCEPDSLAIA